jgi:hypothetical protein
LWKALARWLLQVRTRDKLARREMQQAVANQAAGFNEHKPHEFLM